ncbi:uncharacterized protein LOC142337931 [Convolutriloba macropyga]|uniref:uncharacterized protein LOC142337931 n=1 Tax=Convolutriloba macropyga TaxID=536237 RepID=UPI003F527EDD
MKLNLLCLSFTSILFEILLVKANTSHMWNSWVNLMHEWADDCTCTMEPIDDATLIYTSDEMNYVDCWKKCLEQNSCHYFSFHEFSFICSHYYWDQVTARISSHSCENTKPQPRWFRIKTPNTRQTENCQDIKLRTPSAQSGMFNVKVRGSTARVFCNMSTGLTYIEATGVSTWGGGPSYITPSYKITHRFSKVQLVIDKCFTYINHADFTYSVMQPAPPLVAGRGWSFFHHGTLFGQAGDCGKDDGYGSIDLTQTGICFSSPSAIPPPNKHFSVTLCRRVEVFFWLRSTLDVILVSASHENCNLSQQVDIRL